MSNHIYPMFSDRQAWANSVDPDEMPQNVASHQGLHCLPLIQHDDDDDDDEFRFNIEWTRKDIFRHNIGQ